MTPDAIVVSGVSKRFRVVTIPKQVSLKEAIVSLQLFNRVKRKARFIEAVRDISFRVPKGSSLGIVGRNGSGKTTLLRMMAGIYRPNAGTIKVTGDIAPLLSLGVGFHPEMTGRENVKLNGLVLGMSPQQIEARFDDIVDFAELREFIDIPVRTYSSGMYMRLAFAIAVSTDPDVLLLDEILAVGDEEFARKCLLRIHDYKQRGKTIVLVSHDPATVASWCETALWMERGAARMFGPAREVMAAYHESGRVEPVPEDLARRRYRASAP